MSEAVVQLILDTPVSHQGAADGPQALGGLYPDLSIPRADEKCLNQRAE